MERTESANSSRCDYIRKNIYTGRIYKETEKCAALCLSLL